MAIYVIIYIVFTCIFTGIMLQNSKKELDKFDWFLIIILGWILAPILILIVFGKLISFLNNYYG